MSKPVRLRMVSTENPRQIVFAYVCLQSLMSTMSPIAVPATLRSKNSYNTIVSWQLNQTRLECQLILPKRHLTHCKMFPAYITRIEVGYPFEVRLVLTVMGILQWEENC